MIINKRDSVTGAPLEGVEFKVTTASGEVVDNKGGQISSNGVYYTNAEGQIVISPLAPGTYVITETATIPGYLIHEATRSQTIVVNTNDTQTVYFYNDPTTTLIIHKYVEGTANKPLAGVAFKVVDGNGGAVGPDDGIYYTDKSGDITLTGLEPGMTVVAREIKTLDGYVLDGTPQDILIKGGTVQQLTFWNKKAGTLVIQKKDSVSGALIPGAEFQVTYANGGFVDNDNGHLSSNGLYTTDDKGEIRISGIVGTVVVTGLIPGSTYVVTETKVPDGYVLNSTPQTITVTNGTGNSVTSGTSSGTGTSGSSGDNSLTFENDPTTTLVIEKYVTGTTTPLKGVTFLVTDSSGAVVGSSNGEYITDENGRIVIEDLEPGVTVTAREIRTVEGYVLDTAPKTIRIKVGEAQTLRFYNDPAGTLVIRKLDKLTGEPLAGVEFELTYAGGGFVDDANGHLSSNGRYTTNDAGEIRISGVVGTIVAKEVKCLPGYTIDPATQTQTVTVNPADTQTLTFYNIPGTTLIIQKLVTGTNDQPLAGVEFLITDSSGAYVGPNNGVYRTDEYGRITLTDLTPGTVITAKETKTVDGYVLDGVPKSIEIKAGEAQTLMSSMRATKVKSHFKRRL